jgi:hypothetical protein
MKSIGHVSGMNIDTTLLDGKPNDVDLIHCISCVMGKHKQLPFPSASCRAQETTELIHSDVWGPVNLASSAGDYYFVVFTDDYM